jgi:hypothetical protein
MSKKLVKKTEVVEENKSLADDVTQTVEEPVETPVEKVETPVETPTVAEVTDAKKKQVEDVTLDLNDEQEAVRIRGICPKCKKAYTKKSFMYPGVNRTQINGVFEGKPYQVVETYRIKCEHCGQTYAVKKYITK